MSIEADGSTEPPAGPEMLAVKMANAAHGARQPGDVIELPVDLARALVRSGEAILAAGPKFEWLEAEGR